MSTALPQIVGFKWKREGGQWQPHFLASSGEEITKVFLWAGPISITLGEKFCTGYFLNGRHFPCPDRQRTSGTMCDACRHNDDFFLCVQCTGDGCVNHKQRHACEKEDYVIYLASFDSLLKVGISRESRFYERLIEQGADFGTKIARVKDGMYVRKMEQSISKFLGCPDRIDGEVKQALLFGDPNAATIQIMKAIARLKDAHWDFPIQPEVYDFRHHYRLGNIKTVPKRLPISDKTEIRGRVVATKGNIAVIRNADGVFSFDARRVIGREILCMRPEAALTANALQAAQQN